MQLSVQHLTIRAGATPILHDISAVFPRGTVTAIVGPNGSGKSTFARAIMGDTALHRTRGTIIIGRGRGAVHLEALPPERRAQHGLFLATQHPTPLPGVRVRDLLSTLCVHVAGQTAAAFRERLAAAQQVLAVPDDLLVRTLDSSLSGGERKKVELLQLLILQPRIIILDEVDTGVDVDALRAIAAAVRTLADGTRTFLVITHNFTFLQRLRPTHALVFAHGRIVARGDRRLIARIARSGFRPHSQAATAQATS